MIYAFLSNILFFYTSTPKDTRCYFSEVEFYLFQIIYYFKIYIKKLLIFIQNLLIHLFFTSRGWKKKYDRRKYANSK